MKIPGNLCKIPGNPVALQIQFFFRTENMTIIQNMSYIYNTYLLFIFLSLHLYVPCILEIYLFGITC